MALAVLVAVTLAVAAALVALAVLVPVAAAALVIIAVAAAAAAALAVAAALAAAAAAVAGVQKRPVEAGRHGVALLSIEQGERLGAHALAADLAQGVEERERGLGAGERELGVLRGRHGERDVLAQVLGHEAGLVVAGDGLGRQGGRRTGAARAAGEKVEDLLGVEVALLGERERVGVAHHAGGKAHLIAELGRLARARLVEVEELLAEGLQDRQHRGHGLLARADDQREGARLGAGLAARDGTVEGVDVGHLGGVVDIASELRRARGEVDEVGALLGRAQDAVGGEVDVLHVGRVADHGEDDVGALGRGGGSLGPGGAAGEQALGLLAGAVVHGEVVARVEDVAGDGRAHDAGADEGHLRVVRVAQVLPFLRAV